MRLPTTGIVFGLIAAIVGNCVSLAAPAEDSDVVEVPYIVDGEIVFPFLSSARLESDGRVTVLFFVIMPGGYSADGGFVIGQGDPEYQKVRDLLGDLPEGELVRIPENLTAPRMGAYSP